MSNGTKSTNPKSMRSTSDSIAQRIKAFEKGNESTRPITPVHGQRRPSGVTPSPSKLLSSASSSRKPSLAPSASSSRKPSLAPSLEKTVGSSNSSINQRSRQGSSDDAKLTIHDISSITDSVANISLPNDSSLSDPPSNPSDATNPLAEGDDTDFRYRSTIDAIRFHDLKSEALYYRRDLNNNDKCGPLPEDLSVTIREPPIFGAAKIIYILDFSDGVTWEIHIPANATSLHYNNHDEAAQHSMVMTIDCILSYCRGLKVPRILAGMVGRNDMGTPFMFMSRSAGEPVSQVWPTLSEAQRLKLLTNLAAAMSSLEECGTKMNIGSALFVPNKYDQTFEYKGIGPLIKFDWYSFLRTDLVYQMEGVPNPVLWPTSTPSGPFNTAYEYLLAALPDPNLMPFPFSPLNRGLNIILRWIIDSIPEHLLDSPCGTVLTHADIDASKILVDAECNITAVMDWEGAYYAPLVLGYTRPPTWLTFDWNPLARPACPSDSHTAVRRYRSHYSNCFPPDPRKEVSHIIEALLVASQYPEAHVPVIQRCLELAFGGPQRVPFDLEQWAFEVGANGVCVFGSHPVESRISIGEVQKVKEMLRGMWTDVALREERCWGGKRGWFFGGL
ncbi:hypothetical protein EDC01DRAFT_732287 [Geopyxis carbonaria]|nr:hypothetical protein EDC01DRAFT_732287 [Geopyxis carbonaria]